MTKFGVGPGHPLWNGGKSSHPLDVRYKAMLNRCSNPEATNFGRYGGRGIRVCQRWVDDFWAFVEDVGMPPGGDLALWTLDRIDNDGNYEPGNVRWATRLEQASNRHEGARSGKNGHPSLTDEQVREIRTRLEGAPRGAVAQLAREYMVHPDTISNIKHRHTRSNA